MAVLIRDEARFETVDTIEIRIGNEHVKHHFGRQVSMAIARQWALHYLNAMTGSPEQQERAG